MTKAVEPTANAVVYRGPDGEQYAVKRYTGEEIGDFAALVLSLVIEAYSNQFEETKNRPKDGRHPLSRDAAFQKFGTAGAHQKQVAKIGTRLASGGAYWYIDSGANGFSSEYRLAALANTTVSRDGLLQKIGATHPNCYLGNVIVHPNNQRRHLGSMVMYTAVNFGGYQPNKLVATDVLIDNPNGEAFFTDRGLTHEANVDLQPMSFPNGDHLHQARYSGIISNIVNCLNDRVPLLTAAEPIIT